jgi:HEAT repeat protein
LFVVVIVAGWLFWSEIRERGWIPGVQPPARDPADRLRELEALVRSGPDGVPELVQRLSDPDPGIRRHVLLALSRIGPRAKSALELIRQAFTDRDATARSCAIDAYCRINEDLAAATPILAAMLADPVPDVRKSAAEELIAIGPPAVSDVVEVLRSDAAEARSEALAILRRLRRWDSAAAIDKAVRTRLEDSDDGVRALALSALVEWGSATPDEIRRHLKSGGVETALRAAAQLGPDAAELLPDVMTLLEQTERLELPALDAAQLRLLPNDIGTPSLAARARLILRCLRAMKTAACPAVPLLLRRVDELTAGNRVAVALVLVDIGANADDVIAILAPLLPGSDGKPKRSQQTPAAADKDIVGEAAAILVRASPAAARRTVALLIPKLQTGGGGVDKTVLNALRGLGHEAGEAVPVLTSLVPHPDGEVFSNAVITLGEIGPEAAPADGALLAQLKGEGDKRDEGAEIRQRIIQALGKFGPSAKSAIPVLLKVVDDPATFVPSGSRYHESWMFTLRLAALKSAAQIGENDPQVLAMLRTQIQSGTPDCQTAAVRWLVLAARQSPQILPEAVSLLSSDAGIVRGCAALAIGELSGDLAIAVEPLISRLKDESPYVQAAAAVALGRIGSAAAGALPALKELQQQDGTLRPLPLYPPYQSRDGVPTIDRIPELDHLTIDRAVREAVAAIAPEG